MVPLGIEKSWPTRLHATAVRRLSDCLGPLGPALVPGSPRWAVVPQLRACRQEQHCPRLRWGRLCVSTLFSPFVGMILKHVLPLSPRAVALAVWTLTTALLFASLPAPFSSQHFQGSCPRLPNTCTEFLSAFGETQPGSPPSGPPSPAGSPRGFFHASVCLGGRSGHSPPCPVLTCSVCSSLLLPQHNGPLQTRLMSTAW